MTEMAWLFLNDKAVDDKSIEYFVLEFNEFDHQTKYRTADLWSRFGDEVLDSWIKKHPGTRPTCWWRYQSGLERKIGPMKLTENITAKRVIHSWRDSIPEDQRTWLLKHGHLAESE